MVMRLKPLAIIACTALVVSIGCGDVKRSNPVDPKVTEGSSLRDELVGTWSRDDAEKNEIYVFRSDGRVELHDFIALDGGDVNRSAAFPETRERVFVGTYVLVGSQLTIIFTSASSNDPADSVSAPVVEKKVNITIRRSTLTLEESDGDRQYVKLS